MLAAGWPLSSVLALGATLAVSLAVALSQPIAAPWWLYADADASYVASGLNLMGGRPTFYLDHPGMPLQDLIAATAEARYLAGKIGGSAEGTPIEYAQGQMLHLDGWRPWYRGFGILFYVLGAAIAYLACSRLLGGPGYGLAGGLLWIGAPGLVAMSIQYRPDVPLAAACLLVAFLTAAAAIRRDIRLYVLAAFALGLAMTVKIHAAGLLPAFVVALALRPPAAGWASDLRREAKLRLRRHRVPLALVAAVWLALAVEFNRERYPFDITPAERHLVEVAALVAAAWAVLLATVLPRRRLTRRLLDPVNAVLAGVFALGVLLPGTLFVDNGLQMLVSMKNGLTGSGVNQGISPFKFAGSTGLLDWPLQQALVVFALGAVAALVAARRRVLWPALLFVGAAVLGVMAAARLGTVHYFAPAYVVSIPGALWLLKSRRAAVTAVAAAALVAYVVVPQLLHAGDASASANRQTALASVLEADAATILKQGQVALVDPNAPSPDTRYNGLVEHFVAEPPQYPNRRLLEDFPSSFELAKQDGLVFRYYIGARALDLQHEQPLTFSFATFRARPVPELRRPDLGIGVAELVAGPGVSWPYGHRDARYDPETGYFEDAHGTYYDGTGRTVVNPPKRRHVGNLWLDRYGDFWNDRGQLVKSDPSLRTAP